MSHAARLDCTSELRRPYRAAKTHRMPGRAASGGTLAPVPAARPRGRTRALQTDCSEPFFLLIFHFFRNQTPPNFEIGLECPDLNVRFETGRLILGDV